MNESFHFKNVESHFILMIKNWCEEHFGEEDHTLPPSQRRFSLYVFPGVSISSSDLDMPGPVMYVGFRDPKDAIMFKLRWA